MTPQIVLAATLESALNRYLQLDEASRRRLAELADLTVAVEPVIPLSATPFFLIFSPSGVRVAVISSDQPVTRLRATPLAFGRWAAGHTNAGVEIEGDQQTAERVQHLLAGVDIDWEELLSRGLGDMAARQLGRLLGRIDQHRKTLTDTLRSNATEYLHYESRDLTDRHEINTFVRDLDDLITRIEALERRLDPSSQDKH